MQDKAGGLTAKGRAMITEDWVKACSAARRRTLQEIFRARNLGQIKKFNIDCRATPEKRACKARRRWKC